MSPGGDHHHQIITPSGVFANADDLFVQRREAAGYCRTPPGRGKPAQRPANTSAPDTASSAAAGSTAAATPKPNETANADRAGERTTSDQSRTPRMTAV